MEREKLWEFLALVFEGLWWSGFWGMGKGYVLGVVVIASYAVDDFIFCLASVEAAWDFAMLFLAFVATA